jgi:DNA repair photolyase
MSNTPLPFIANPATDSSSLPEQSAQSPQLFRLERQGNLLFPTGLGDRDEVLGLDLTHGCVHRCGFCWVRAGQDHGGDEGIVFYVNTADRLAQELGRLERKPKAVYLCPATDPFPPLADVQEETARIVRVLAEHGVGAWLMTRGQIQPAALQVLSQFRAHVKVTVCFTTLDQELQQVLEPGTASPEARLEQIAALRQLGIPVQVALDPLVPGLTDSPDNIRTVLISLAGLGITHVTAGYLILRQGIADNLRQALALRGWADLVLNAFVGGPMLTAPGMAPARYLPRSRRQHGYSMLMALAAEQGIAVTISSLTNPDFAGPRPAPDKARPSLLALFLQAGRKQAAAS